ncbi:unnamed protein product [Notodromas monacha]|uniref:D-2-hydroxyglutarate dehydrogenase, mitochondrial n=1 Tax=Notodromas monacha TaxID=399045 RepID=A0A7R9GB19_9CRUS|nr:unnamed protein product [Notodromas monacha]CAG0914616.1 unnamed protein product [Notodromas monacha]
MLSRLGAEFLAVGRISDRYFIRRCVTKITTNDGIKSPKPEYTSKRYSVKRGDFSCLEDRDIVFFKHLLDKNRVLTDPFDLEKYNVDWLKTVRGKSACVLKPRTTKEVSEIMRYCNEKKLAVVPQGGNTGLVGGSVPVFDEIVLSTELMTRFRISENNPAVVIAQAGCVLEKLDTALNQHNLMVPLDLGAKGSCHIGGNVSTNAGGVRVLRYRNLHGSVLGLEAVLADGTIFNGLSTNLKDNSGYDLRHLFIGSEGTLGVVTRVAILCSLRPKSVTTCLLAVPDFESLLKVFVVAKQRLGEIMSACEFMDSDSVACAKRNLGIEPPIQSRLYALLETHGMDSNHDEEKVDGFINQVMKEGLITDGILTSEPSKMKKLWEIRERLAEALRKEGYTYKYDVSLPFASFYKIVEVMRKRLPKTVITCCGYGHLGDNNLHFNVTTKEFDPTVLTRIEPFLYEYTKRCFGSISAEHGIGFKKRNYLYYSKNPAFVHMMAETKRTLDPNGILNPYKVLPDFEA